MLQGHELTTPIQYGYLILAGILILMACIAGITYIIRDIRANATTEPDYLAHWEKIRNQKKSDKKLPFENWISDEKWISDQEINNVIEGFNSMSSTKVLSAMVPTSTSPEKHNSSGIYKSLTKPPFHWETFLDDLIKDCCTPGQIERAKVLSAHFQTCPCGHLDPAIPRKEDGEPGQPEDEELCMLGAEFWQALCMDDYFRARDIYHQIKAREKQLLNINQSIS